MATRAEVLDKLKTAASEGNIREAYREFEELPIVDQIAISVSPGIGDALAVYEIGEFGARGAKNIEERDFLGALGNYGLSGLSAISILPLFRLFRTAKTAKSVVKTPDVPEAKVKVDKKEFKEEPKKDLPVPKVEEFAPLGVNDLVYPGTRLKANMGLTSKAAKFVNYNKNLPNQGKAVAFVNALIKGGVPKGELRLLNIIDETGEIHPKLLSELEIRNPQGKITRQRLAEYIYSNQRDGALQSKMVSKYEDLAAPDRLKNSNLNNPVDEKEATYHIRGLERKAKGAHYRNSDIHSPHYVFDAKIDLTIPDSIAGTSLKGFKEGDKVLNLGRIQSDYSSELADAAAKNKALQIEAIKTYPDFRVWDKKLQDLGFEIDLRDEMIKTVRQMPDSKPEKMRESFLKSLRAKGIDESRLSDSKAKEKFKLEYFEEITPAVKAAQENFPISPFIDGKKLKGARKSLDEYNKKVPKVNELVAEKAELQDKLLKLNESGLTPDSPSIKIATEEIDEQLGAINSKILDLMSDEATELYDGFTLTAKDLRAVTGKPLKESLDKSLDEIYYDIEELGGGAIRQKYGPGTPGERAKRYFDELVNDKKTTFNIGDGLTILKKATKINKKLFPGVAIDPYAKSTGTETFKLPIRSRFTEAVIKGYDGFSVDSAAKRLGDEAAQDKDNIYLNALYDKNAPNEIAKMLKELGADPKKYMSKLENTENLPGDTATAFSGTYVKIDDELRKLVQEKGVDAFKAGGPAIKDDDLPEIEDMVLLDPVGSQGMSGILLAMMSRGMNPIQKAAALRPILGKYAKKIKELEKAKQNYIRTNKATQVDKYAQRINRFNKDIKATEKKIEDVKKLYGQNLNTGGPVSIESMLAAL